MSEITSAPYQKLEAACLMTGMSVYSLRRGCKDGSVPHVMRNGKYYINVPELLRQLNEESKSGGRASA